MMPQTGGVQHRLLHLLSRLGPPYVLILLLSSCSHPQATTALAPRSSCAIVGSRSPAPGDTLSVAATTPIDQSHAPAPRNAAERLAFAQLYETLINVDCEAHVYPGLAKSWTLDDSRTRITLTIRNGAQFWNGKPVVAADVVASWRATGAQTSEASNLARRMADAATIVDDHTLTVSLPDTTWRTLADPALAVYQPQSGPAWPDGTARYQPTEPSAGREPGPLLLTPRPSTGDPYIAIRPLPTRDARDAIDAGVDLLVTDDPVVVSYAETRSSHGIVPLPWSRTYVLAVPAFGAADAQVLHPILGDSSTPFRVSLARDAVRADARTAEAPYWWSGSQSCGSLAPPGTPARRSEERPLRIAFDSRDRIARQLAERLAVLGRRAVALPLSTDTFARALHGGSEPAFVIALPRASLDPCYDAAKLAATAPWLPPASGQGQSAPATIIPLIDTRDRAIVKRNRISATIDWDGTLRLGGLPRAP